MSTNPYQKMHALVIDDFESFRITLTKMLQEFGIEQVDSVANANEALRACAVRAYDLILCDLNLGKGKTGQQILEVLRKEPNLNSHALFLLISAEANKSIIMAAYDFEPDAYLAKPITGQALMQRLERLFAQKLAFTDVHTALQEKQFAIAEARCRELIRKKQSASMAYKILGKLLLDEGKFKEAEDTYHEVLETRQLDWAMIGMAQAKLGQHDLLSAQQWLDDAIQANPMCLKAYDVLARVHEQNGNISYEQKTVEQAVNLSPLSVLRLQKLGKIYLRQNDLLSAANTLRRAVKQGENSCFDDVSVHTSFSQACVELAKVDKNTAKTYVRDALKVLAELPEKFPSTADAKMSSLLLETQLQSLVGEERRARELMVNIEKQVSSSASELSLAAKIELVRTYREMGKQTESEELIAQLLKEYEGQEDCLEQIDCLLDEPCSAKNKALVAKINKEGIAHYEKKAFDKAAEAFSSAIRDLPQHIGLRLNLAQAQLGLLSLHPSNQEMIQRVQQTLDYIKQIIPDRHAQHKRYKQIEEVFRSLLVNSKH